MRKLLVWTPILFLAFLVQSYFWVPTYEEQTKGNPERLREFITASIGDAQMPNPILSADSASSDIVNRVFEGLLDYDRDLSYRGRLAARWEIYEEAWFCVNGRADLPGLDSNGPEDVANLLREAVAKAKSSGDVPEDSTDFLSNIRGCKIPIFAALLLAAACVCAEARQIVDMSGRQISVPDTIRKIYGASPPATLMVCAMDPGLVAGLNFPLEPSESQYLDARMEKLPVIGGWFGQGRATNLETLLRVRPDLVLIWIWKESAINEKIEQALKPLNIPVVYVALDSVDDYLDAYPVDLAAETRRFYRLYLNVDLNETYV